MKPLKTLFIVSSDLFVRNYLQTNALQQIEDENLYFAATSAVTLRDNLESRPNFVGTVHYDDTLTNQHLFLSSVLMLRHQDRSKTFAYRFKRQSSHVWDKLEDAALSKTRTVQSLSQFLPRSLALTLTRGWKMWKRPPNERKYIHMWLLGRPGLAEWYARRFEKQVPPNAELRQLLERVRPDVVILPSTAIEPIGNDLIRLQRQLNYRTLYLIDNWDNLSSKSVYLNLPDYMAVWGEQSREHARQIHHMPDERIFKIGTPRFEQYYEAMARIDETGQVPESPYPFRYVLYVGCAIEFDERTSLQKLDAALEELNRNRAEPIKLVYRPHPWRLKRSRPDRVEPNEFKHVVLDEQLREHYYNPQPKGLFQPALNYYPRLLANAEAVIGPLTTMLMEAAIFRKKVLAFAYDDGLHLSSPCFALKYYRHFEGLTEMPGWSFAHQLQTLDQDFLSFVSTLDQPFDLEKQAQHVQYYIYRNETTPYPQRLQNFLNQVKAEIPGSNSQHPLPSAASDQPAALASTSSTGSSSRNCK